jgi:hypothetical protein
MVFSERFASCRRNNPTLGDLRRSILFRLELSFAQTKEGVMIALRLVRLIEAHSEELAHGLIEKMERCEKCTDLHRAPRRELESRAHEIYRNLSDWLLTKTEADIERVYRKIGQRRAEQGVHFSHFYWAMIVTKEQLWEFLEREGLHETPIDLRAGMELFHLTEQFFERAIYYAALEYEEYRMRESERHAVAVHV